VLFCSLAAGEYRVSAKTSSRAKCSAPPWAPCDGYVAQSLVRAGDTVKKGQVLAAGRARAKLEQTRLASEQRAADAQHRQAFAALGPASLAVIAAQFTRRRRSSLVEGQAGAAPRCSAFRRHRGVRDLSQLLGSPVEQGKVLFRSRRWTPTRDPEVDERDIAHVRVGQQGELALSACRRGR